MCGNRRAGGAGCMSQGALKVFKTLNERAKARGGHVTIIKSVCMGYCGEGPNVKIRGGAFFHGVTPEDVEGILDTEDTFHD